jgi:hypothetical protein
MVGWVYRGGVWVGGWGRGVCGCGVVERGPLSESQGLLLGHLACVCGG